MDIELNNGFIKEIGTTTIGKYILKIYNNTENPLFLAKQIAEMLEYPRTGKYKRSYDTYNLLRNINEENVCKAPVVENNKKKTMLFVSFEAFCQIIMSKNKDIFEETKKNILKILSEINRNGKFDIVEKGIETLNESDEKCNILKSINLYNQLLKINSNDYLTAINLRQAQLELKNMENQQRIEKVEVLVNNQNKIIESISKIGNKVQLNNEIKSIACRYGIMPQEAYRLFYKNMLDVYRIDLQRRVLNRHNSIQEDRLSQGKAIYSKVTLDSKCNKISIICENNLWREASFCLLKLRKDLEQKEMEINL